MQTSNSILNELGIDTEEFFWNKNVFLYKENDVRPFGQVTLENGHYRLTVGYVDDTTGRKHIVK